MCAVCIGTIWVCDICVVCAVCAVCARPLWNVPTYFYLLTCVFRVSSWWLWHKHYQRIPNQIYNSCEDKYLAYGSRPRCIGSSRFREPKLPTHHWSLLNAGNCCPFFPRQIKATICKLTERYPISSSILHGEWVYFVNLLVWLCGLVMSARAHFVTWKEQWHIRGRSTNLDWALSKHTQKPIPECIKRATRNPIPLMERSWRGNQVLLVLFLCDPFWLLFLKLSK